MSGIATQLFRFVTQARASQVWEALTRPELTSRYLYGLAAQSEWGAGAAVVFAASEEGVILTGEILVAQEPRRLSYSLQAGDGQPATYVTWEILGTSAGCVVRLYVDEPGEPAPEPDVETESAWVPVVAGLEAILASSAADRH